MLRLDRWSVEVEPTEVNVNQDKLVIIRIDGMHCHQCEAALQSALGREEGVHEVEVDFLSGQCSVLFDPAKVRVDDLVTAIEQAGYRPGETFMGGLGVEA